MLLNKEYIVFNDSFDYYKDVKIGDTVVLLKETSCGRGAESILINGEEVSIPSTQWCHFLIPRSNDFLTLLTEESVKEVSSKLQKESDSLMERLIRLDILIKSKGCE